METEFYIRELEELRGALRSESQYIGFHHKFYIPGWIGWIQRIFVEKKMDQQAKKPIYKGKGYYDCGFKIASLVYDACESRRLSDPCFQKDNNHPAHQAIYLNAMQALKDWSQIYPEIAEMPNRRINDQTYISTSGLLYHKIQSHLSEIMDVKGEDKINVKPKESMLSDIIDFGQWLITWACNMIVFVAIFSILIAIFG